MSVDMPPKTVVTFRASQETRQASNAPDFALFDIKGNKLLPMNEMLSVFTNPNIRGKVSEVLVTLTTTHPKIAIDPNMLGGMPHIKGHRLSVGDILAQLYIYGNLDKVLEIYKDQKLSREQLKEAIAFAQDFLEAMSGQQ